MSAEVSNYDAEVFVYTGPRGATVPRGVVRVRVDPFVTSIPARAFARRKKLAEVELCELLKLGSGPSMSATVQLQKSTSPTHSGGYNIGPSGTLFDAPFVFMMA